MKNLFYLFALTLVFTLTSCEKEELESEDAPQSQNNSGNSTNSGNTSTPPNDLRIYKNGVLSVVDYSSVLYKMIDVHYFVYSLNGVVDPNYSTIKFSDTELSIGEYEVDDNSSTNNKWYTVDVAGTKFRYPQLVKDNLAYSAEVEIVSYDNTSGEIMAVFWRSNYATSQDTIIMRRN